MELIEAGADPQFPVIDQSHDRKGAVGVDSP